MGLNRRGSDLLRAFLATQRVVVTWLCDVDRRAREKAEPLVREQQARPFRTTADIRNVLDDRRVEAVIIATPSHWHAPAAILALQAGKHVYLETPISHNPREGEWLVEAARRARRVLQVGLQRRSAPWIMEAMNRVHAGELGPVRLARAWYSDRRTSIGFGQLAPVPSELDYALWQGPAPDRPFRDNVVHSGWPWLWHWGTGELGNSGVHFLDLARWGLQLDCPIRVTSVGGRYFFDDDQETPDTQVVTYDYGDRALIWEHRSCQSHPLDGEAAGVAFYGQLGTLIVGESGYRVVDPDGKETVRRSGEISTASHVANFLECLVNPARTPHAGVEDGHISTLLCHLGNIAQRSGADIELNPTTRQLRSPRAASQFWSRQYRREWQPRV